MSMCLVFFKSCGIVISFISALRCVQLVVQIYIIHKGKRLHCVNVPSSFGPVAAVTC